jgi:hypothetical protein
MPKPVRTEKWTYDKSVDPRAFSLLYVQIFFHFLPFSNRHLHTSVLLILLNWPCSPKWTFASCVAFFHSSQFLDVCLLNICPNTLPPSRSWPSCCSYTLRLTVENLLDFSGTILLIYVATPIQYSHSYGGNSIHIFIQSL